MRIAALALALLSAGPALALSCFPPDPAADFLDADASEDSWLVVEGDLTFNTALLPERDMLDNDAKDVEIPARFRGKSLSLGGFDRDFITPITLRLTCAGPWCGGAAPGNMIAFLKREAGGYVMIADPCGTRVYPDASPEVRNRLTQCMRGGVCKPSDPFK